MTDDPRRERDMNLRSDASWRERSGGIRPWHVFGALIVLLLLLAVYLKPVPRKGVEVGVWSWRPAPALVVA